MGLLLLSSIIITFGKTYAVLLIGRFIYETSWVFKDVQGIMLKNNLKLIGKPDDYAKITNRGQIIYALLTFIVSLMSGFLFNINPYIPMYLCIAICLVTFIMYLGMKDVSKDNIVVSERKEKGIKVLKFNKIVWIAILSFTLFYGCLISVGQDNGKLMIQYELAKVYDVAKVSIYLGIITSLSRITRLISTSSFNKIYSKIKDRYLLLLVAMIISALSFMVIGFFIQSGLIRFILMTIGYCLTLACRDPLALYTNDLILKHTKPEEQKRAISYLQLGRKLGTTMWGLVASAILLKWEIIYVIIATLILSIVELFVVLKLYSMVEINKLKQVI